MQSHDWAKYLRICANFEQINAKQEKTVTIFMQFSQFKKGFLFIYVFFFFILMQVNQSIYIAQYSFVLESLYVAQLLDILILKKNWYKIYDQFSDKIDFAYQCSCIGKNLVSKYIIVLGIKTYLNSNNCFAKGELLFSSVGPLTIWMGIQMEIFMEILMGILLGILIRILIGNMMKFLMGF